MLKLTGLSAGYGELKVLKNVSLHVQAGEIVTIIGANGAGKTTLLSAIAALIRHDDGEVMLKGKHTGNRQPDDLVHSGCVLIPEGRQLFAPLTVRENLILGGYILCRRTSRKQIHTELERIYKLFPRLKERENQLAGTLSGGEQQMLAIGRALMSRPDLIMMDEPSMGLAPIIIKEIFRIICSLRDEGKTILIVEQNARASLKIADRGYVMETGNVVMEGSAEELLMNPAIQSAYLGKQYRTAGV